MNRAIRKKNRIITTAPETVATGFPLLQALAMPAPHPPAKGETSSVTKIVVTHLMTVPPVPAFEAPLLTYSDPASSRPQAVYRPGSNAACLCRRRSFNREQLPRRQELLIATRRTGARYFVLPGPYRHRNRPNPTPSTQHPPNPKRNRLPRIPRPHPCDRHPADPPLAPTPCGCAMV